jgi:exopolyphosphatase/guanosine-5'-triphosphate,3'-diphosphate pyrophosphatase
VLKLGGILRLADGLDRRRSKVINRLNCIMDKKQFIIDLDGEDDLSVEIYGAQTKGDLFRESFDLKLVVRHNSAAA